MKKYKIILLLLILWDLRCHGQNLVEPPTDFPSNYVVKEWHPSYLKGTHVFYENNNYLFIRGGIQEKRKEYEFGKWSTKNGIVTINIEFIVGIRPVGKVLNPDVYHASHPDGYLLYEYYTKFEDWTKKTYSINPKEFLWEDCYIDLGESPEEVNINLRSYKIAGDFKIASCKRLEDSDIEDLTKAELRLMRNEIFARYGYAFKSNDLQEHFKKFAWYIPTKENVDIFLTETEKANIKLIQQYEK